MSPDFSYYDVLGISSTASAEEIKVAYRASMLKYHPDVNSAPNAAKLTIILNDAYAILSDPAKRRAYDEALASGSPMHEPGEEPNQTWDLYACDSCGHVDVHLRLAMFFKVWSIFIYTHMNGDGGVLCPDCRSKKAISTALFSAFLGVWGFPWGIFYTLRSLFASVRGGEFPRQQNAQLLRHQGIAFLQRGYVNEARTALEASQQFEKSDAVTELLREPVFHVSTTLPQHGWLKGQTVTLGIFAIPPLLVFIVLMLFGSSGTSTKDSQAGTTAQTQQQENDSALKAYIDACKAKPTSANAQSRYDNCKSAVTWIVDDAKNASVVSEENQMDQVYADIARAYQSDAAYDLGRKTESTQLSDQTTKSLASLRDNGVTPAVKTKARIFYDCFVDNKCSAANSSSGN